MAELQRESMIFYKSFLDAIESLSEDSQYKILKAILGYGLKGEKPALDGVEKMAFVLIKPQLDANANRYKNGCKGGRPKTKTKPKENQNETKVKPNYNENENVNENENENENENGEGNMIDAPAIDFQDIIRLFNEICISLPRVSMITDERKADIEAVFDIVEDFGGFEPLFEKIDRSDFLCGRDGRKWRATFDWLLKKDNLIKVIEGNYDNDAAEVGHGTLDASLYDTMINAIDQ